MFTQPCHSGTRKLSQFRTPNSLWEHHWRTIHISHNKTIGDTTLHTTKNTEMYDNNKSTPHIRELGQIVHNETYNKNKISFFKWIYPRISGISTYTYLDVCHRKNGNETVTFQTVIIVRNAKKVLNTELEI